MAGKVPIFAVLDCGKHSLGCCGAPGECEFSSGCEAACDKRTFQGGEPQIVGRIDDRGKARLAFFGIGAQSGGGKRLQARCKRYGVIFGEMAASRRKARKAERQQTERSDRQNDDRRAAAGRQPLGGERIGERTAEKLAELGSHTFDGAHPLFVSLGLRFRILFFRILLFRIGKFLL